MGRDIYEEIAARHLQMKPGVFVRVDHDPWGKGGTAQIDVVAIDLVRKTIIVVEVKSGGIGDFATRAERHRSELEPRLRAQFSDFALDLSEWPFEYRLYVKSSYQKAAQERAGSKWDVRNLDDAFNELLRN